jgi:hypothetical protein
VALGLFQIGVGHGHFAGLLAGGDDQWGVGSVGGHQAAHRVAGACGGVQVDQSRLTGGLGEAVGHGQRGGFLQGEHVGEVFGKILQERLLRGTGVSENRCDSQLSKKIVGDVVNGRLISHWNHQLLSWNDFG